MTQRNSPAFDMRDFLQQTFEAGAYPVPGVFPVVRINAPEPDDPVPYVVIYLITRNLMTVDGIYSWEFRLDCCGESFVQAQTFAEDIRLIEDWPWKVFHQSEKDEYLVPQDGTEVLHIVSTHLQVVTN